MRLATASIDRALLPNCLKWAPHTLGYVFEVKIGDVEHYLPLWIFGLCEILIIQVMSSPFSWRIYVGISQLAITPEWSNLHEIAPPLCSI